MISLDLALYSLDNLQQEDSEWSNYLDENGNHSYYERALIEKKQFLDSIPQLNQVKFAH